MWCNNTRITHFKNSMGFMHIKLWMNYTTHKNKKEEEDNMIKFCKSISNFILFFDILI